jgi:hypothetical protein
VHSLKVGLSAARSRGVVAWKPIGHLAQRLPAARTVRTGRTTWLIVSLLSLSHCDREAAACMAFAWDLQGCLRVQLTALPPQAQTLTGQGTEALRRTIAVGL